MKTPALLITLVIAAMAILVILNFIPFLFEPAQEKFISLNNIRGMAVEYQGEQYTLNFEQQKRVAVILNRSTKIGLEGYLTGEEVSFDYSLLTIFPFQGKVIRITPVGFANQQLIFQSKELNPEGLLRETGPGEMHPLLSETYDK
jgi:hypothetical protein